MRDIESIKNFCIDFCKTFYNINFNIPIYIVDDLEEAAFFSYYYNNDTNKSRPKCIEFNKNLILNNSIEDIVGVIKHECIHYCFCCLELDFQDEDIIFLKELERFDAPTTVSVIVFDKEEHIKRYK